MKLYLTILLYTIFLTFHWGLNASAMTDHTREKAISKAEEFFNNMASYEAEFLQQAFDNSNRKGKLYILKPNRVRLEYLGANPEVIIVDNDFVTHYAPDIDEVNFMPNEGIPIGFLGKSNINLRKDFKVTNVSEINGQLMMVLEVKYKEQKSIVTVLFAQEPFDIQSISVIDENGDNVQLKMLNTRKNQHLNPKLFEIKRVE
jgi:outer membrane lipoprotein-sorting protein